MVERSERRWLGIFTLVVLLLTTLPYVVAYSRQGGDWRFTGFVFGVEDGNSYIAKMLSGSARSWLFRTPYTPYQQRGFLAFMPYLLLGKLAAPPGEHEQLVSLFHLFRLAAGIAYIFATYDFLALYLPDPRWRRFGTVLATLGGGLGWLAVLGLRGLWKKGLPLEFYSPETFGFLMVFGLPHLAFGRAFLLWGLRTYLGSAEDHAKRAWLRGGLLWIGLGLMQPLTVVVGWALLGAHLAFTAAWMAWIKRRAPSGAFAVGSNDPYTGWRAWWVYLLRAVGIGVLSAPLVIYTFLSFRVDPFLSSWEGQNIIASPPPLDYLLAFALLLPLCVLGVRRLLRADPWAGWLVIGWLALVPFLAYAPYNLQRRLPEGVWIAWIALGLYGLSGAGPRLQRWASRGLWLAYPSTIFLFLGSLLAAWAPGWPLFRPAAEIEAFQTLAGAARPGEVALAAYDTSNALPAWAPLRTLVGHGPESVNGEELTKRVTCFYSQPACSDRDRLALLNQFHVSYVVWGPAERALGDWNPTGAAYLSLLGQAGEYQVYRYQARSAP